VILYCAERATRMALDAIQVLGGNGYCNEFPTGRYLRDSKLYEIGAGTSEIRPYSSGGSCSRSGSRMRDFGDPFWEGGGDFGDPPILIGRELFKEWE